MSFFTLRSIRRPWVPSRIVVVVICVAAFGLSAAMGAGLLSSQGTGVEARIGRVPMLFEPILEESLFLARGSGYSVAVGREHFRLALSAQLSERSSDAFLELRFVGGDPSAKPVGEKCTETLVHSFRGNDPAEWRRASPTYARVRISSLYPGIDLVLYGNRRSLEYDFVIAPGADPSQIAFELRGADDLAIDEGGDLLVILGGFQLRHLKPIAYQETEQGRQSVVGSYRLLADGRVGFDVGRYDSRRPLIIDPIVALSSYLGGIAEDIGRAVLVDAAGAIYITGSTLSTDFVLQRPLQANLRGARDVFVTKIDPTDFSIDFSTYLGGSSDDVGTHLARDQVGNIYLAGHTESGNFPVTPETTQPFRRGGREAFLVRLSNDGGTLLYSTFWGGSSLDVPGALLVDPDGTMTLVGHTTSFNFPVTNNALQQQPVGEEDLFISSFSPFGNVLFSTLMGGSGRDQVHSARKGGSLITMTGETRSNNFPLANPFQGQLNGDQDAFFLQFDLATIQLVFSSYLGGSGVESGRGIGFGTFGQLFVAGETNSLDFPVINAVQAQNRGLTDLFVMRINPFTLTPLFSTFLGGSQDDFLGGLFIEPTNVLVLAGSTRSTDFPLVDPEQALNAGGLDGFTARLDPTRMALLSSTFLGGSQNDRIHGLAVDANGRLILTGETASANFPVTDEAFQSNLGGGIDGFVAVITESFQLNFAQFGDGQGEGDTAFASRIELINRSPTLQANLRIVLRADDGSPMSVDLNGAPVEGLLETAVPPGGNIRLVTDGQGPLQTGSVQVTSDVEVDGFVFFDAGSIGATGVRSSSRLRTLLAPVEVGNGINTGLALMGLGFPQELLLVLRTAEGQVVGQAVLGLAAFEHRALFVTEIEWNNPIDFSDFRGNLSGTAESDFAATAILTRPGQFIVVPVGD